MAALTNTVTTIGQVTNREDLTDHIYMISLVDTPVQAAFGKNKAKAVLHEWPQDILAAAAANAQAEGDDPTVSNSFAAAVSPTRPNNRCQISFKNVVVSGTQDAVSKAGRTRDIIYQTMKRTRELRRDMEFVITNNQTPQAGPPRQLRPMDSWYVTNVSRGVGGSSGSSTTAATDGTQRSLTESLTKSMIQAAWTQGGQIDTLICGPFNKTVISGFTGNNTRTQDTTDKKLVAAINIYVSDFGTHKIIADKFSRDRDLHILDTDLWKVSTLRPLQTLDLARTGDAEKAMILAEYTIECGQEAGNAIVADLLTA